MEPIQPIHVTDEYTPYSIIPMMYPTNGTLLSDWPEYLSQRTYRFVAFSSVTHLLIGRRHLKSFALIYTWASEGSLLIVMGFNYVNYFFTNGRVSNVPTDVST